MYFPLWKGKELNISRRSRHVRESRKIRLSPLLTALLTAGLTLLITMMVLSCQPNRLSGAAALLWQNPVRIVLNALPVGLLLLLFASLSGSLFSGAAIANLLLCFLSIANRIKVEVRDEPVFPRDLSLLREVGSAMESYDIHFPTADIARVLLVTMLLFAAGLVLRAVPETRQKARTMWKARLVGAFASLAVLVLLTFTLFASNSLYDSLETSNPYRLSVVFNENGFLYNFFHQFTTYQVERPAGYSRAQAEAWDRAEAALSDNIDIQTGDIGKNEKNGKDVHIILVMNEAFSDITDDPVFAFPPEEDPLSALHEIQSDPHGLALRLIVPGFAGGTANTEFDVLTGMQTNALGAGTTSAFRTVNRNLDSLFRVFAADGYRTAFYHPGDCWFYNRENVYRWLGAEGTLFIEDMQEPAYRNPEYKGRWVTDAYLAGLMEDKFIRTTEEGRTLFLDTTTIQNHMGYPRSKYGEDYDYPPLSLSANAPELPEDVRSMLEVYAEGVRDADAMLRRLRDFFAERPEAVLLVFYGDHLPYLGDNRLSYAALGMDIAAGDGERENYFSIYETPCVIWANGAAAAVLDWDTAVPALDLPENGRLSAAFLGAALLELTGRGKADAWISFLNELRRLVPVVQRNVWMLPDGTAVDGESGLPINASGEGLPKSAVLSETEREALAGQIQKWRQWSYYKLEQKD